MQKIKEVEIVPYSDEYVKLHEEFAKKFWPDKRRRRVDSYNRWKFRGPSKNKVEGLLIALCENKIVGQIGLIPVELKNKNNIYNAQWICDWMVDSEYRSLGIGSKLSEAAMMRDEMITLGNNPSAKAEQVMLKVGFTHLKCRKTMIFPLDSKQILKWVVPEKLNPAVPLLSKLIQPYFSIKIQRSKLYKSDFRICNWEDIVSLIDERQSKIDYPQILHDKKFLEWRADGLENFAERIKALKSVSGSYALYLPFAEYLDVYDWYCKSFEDVKQLFSSILNLALENKRQMIQLIPNSDEEEEWLKKLGFIKARSAERVLQYSKKKFIDKEDKFYFALFDTDLNL